MRPPADFDVRRAQRDQLRGEALRLAVLAGLRPRLGAALSTMTLDEVREVVQQLRAGLVPSAFIKPRKRRVTA